MKQFVLHGDTQAAGLAGFLREHRHQAAASGKPLIVTITEDDKRSAAQNRMMHSMFGDLHKQVKWHGKLLTALTWKRLCMAAYLREINEKPELIPALDGNGFDVIYERTSSLGVRKGSGLIEWTGAFGAEHDVQWTKFGKIPEEHW